VTPENSVTIKGRLSQGPAKRADRALQKVVRKVLHITSYERVCSSHSLKLYTRTARIHVLSCMDISEDGNKMCMCMSLLHLWIIQNVHYFCSKQYFRDPRCLTDLVRCCVIVDSIQVSSPLFQLSLVFSFLPVQPFYMSRLVLCLCVCLCFCMCVCTSVSVHSLTAKLAGCLHMPWRNIFAGCNRDRK
jgi:hypothetical protein